MLFALFKSQTGIGTLSDQRAAILTGYKLTVWSITYADGQTWNRTPPYKTVVSFSAA